MIFCPLSLTWNPMRMKTSKRLFLPQFLMNFNQTYRCPGDGGVLVIKFLGDLPIIKNVIGLFLNTDHIGLEISKTLLLQFSADFIQE